MLVEQGDYPITSVIREGDTRVFVTQGDFKQLRPDTFQTERYYFYLEDGNTHLNPFGRRETVLLTRRGVREDARLVRFDGHFSQAEFPRAARYRLVGLEEDTFEVTGEDQPLPVLRVSFDFSPEEIRRLDTQFYV